MMHYLYVTARSAKPADVRSSHCCINRGQIIIIIIIIMTLTIAIITLILMLMIAITVTIGDTRAPPPRRAKRRLRGTETTRTYRAAFRSRDAATSTITIMNVVNAINMFIHDNDNKNAL